ncbi:MAG: SCO family protein [Kangiellaceae bacterium]|nr:SCO family protein [Kangiellaceae bacterium]
MILANKISIALLSCHILLAGICCSTIAQERSSTDKSASEKNEQGHVDHDMHAAHRAAMKNTNYVISRVDYSLPNVELITSVGKKIKLNSVLDTNKSLALNFIFTTCTTICPVMTATFAQMRTTLGDSGKNLRMISITIDPEYDRPRRLKEYSENFDSGYDWLFLTGTSGDISKVTRSFDAYNGSKMNHKPVTLLKNSNDEKWIRVDGLVSSSSLAKLINEHLLD